MLNTRTWKWTLDYEDLTLSAGTADYTTPADFKEARALERINSSSKPDGRFQFKDPKSFLYEHPRSTQNGAPTIYTCFNALEFSTISFDIAPSSTFVATWPTARLWHFRRLQLYTQDSDTGDFPAEVDNYVIWYARGEVAASLAPDKSGYAIAMADRVWRELRRDSNRFHDFAIGDYGQGLNLRAV